MAFSSPTKDYSAKHSDTSDCYHGPSCAAAKTAAMAAVRRSAELRKTVTLWDLRRITGIDLHTVFTAVRELEAAHMLTLRANPHDIFGATLELANPRFGSLSSLTRKLYKN